jgi:hypothetical protein
MTFTSSFVPGVIDKSRELGGYLKMGMELYTPFYLSKLILQKILKKDRYFLNNKS